MNSSKSIEFDRLWQTLQSKVAEDSSLPQDAIEPISLVAVFLFRIASSSGSHQNDFDSIQAIHDPLGEFLLPQAKRVVDNVAHEQLLSAIVDFIPASQPDEEVLMRLFELRDQQKKSGSYYTPKSVANKMVQDSFCISQPDEVFSVLEPAAGSGIFLTSLIDAYEKQEIPNRLHITAVDLSPASIAVLNILISQRIQRLDENRQRQIHVELWAGNTLSSELDPLYQQINHQQINRSNDDPKKLHRDFEAAVRKRNYQLVIGNPPFLSLTKQTSPFLKQLLHGQLDGNAGSKSYYEIDGVKLGEKKTWLHDEYIQFLRFAQWQIDRSGEGTVAFVLNSGFINNLTFRGLRFQLLQSFDELEIIDLGGDYRNRTHASDENVFNIQTGIAALIASKNSANHDDGKDDERVSFTKLTGTIDEKLRWCDSVPEQSVARMTVRLNPVAPHYRFDRIESTTTTEFQAGWCVTEVFQKKWSAPVTARDHLVIDLTRDLLIKKINRFLDESKTDDEIRDLFFPSARSTRYPRGDTRSWNLENARQQLRKMDWTDRIERCSYRPFDQRFVLWTPEMIDWPRRELAAQFQISNNVCFLFRRQAPPNLPYDYFWACNQIPIDGIIRSDNRGNEYCFPLFTVGNDNQTQLNFSDRWLQHLCKTWNLSSPNELLLAPEMLGGMIYAVVNSSEYRIRFGDELANQYPRIPTPRKRQMANEIAMLGNQLLDCHLQPIESTIAPPTEAQSEKEELDNRTVESYRVGTYQVWKKLKSEYKKHQQQDRFEDSSNELRSRIRRTMGLREHIDRLIEEQGGFEAMFE